MNFESEQAARVEPIVNIPLAFHAKKLNDQSASQHQATPPAFNDTRYKVRLIRYMANLKDLIDNPPELEHCSADDIHKDQMDNYLWVVGELINAMHELGHKDK